MDSAGVFVQGHNLRRHHAGFFCFQESARKQVPSGTQSESARSAQYPAAVSDRICVACVLNRSDLQKLNSKTKGRSQFSSQITVFFSIMAYRHLDSNLIGEVPHDTFHDMHQLRQLWLDTNHLQNVPSSALNKAPSLEALWVVQMNFSQSNLHCREVSFCWQGLVAVNWRTYNVGTIIICRDIARAVWRPVSHSRFGKTRSIEKA